MHSPRNKAKTGIHRADRHDERKVLCDFAFTYLHSRDVRDIDHYDTRK